MIRDYYPVKEFKTDKLDELNTEELKQVYFQWREKKRLHRKYPKIYKMDNPQFFIIDKKNGGYFYYVIDIKLLNLMLKKFKKASKNNIDLVL